METEAQPGGEKQVKHYVIGRSELDLAGFVGICNGGTAVELGAEARAAVVECLDFRRGLESGNDAVYGVNTGFGKLADTRIPSGSLGLLQENLIRSHAVGWGPHLSLAEARGMIYLRAASLAHGHSGVRPDVIEQLLWLLESGVHPYIPSRGSVGASGDLAPLAHLALVLMGEGHVIDAAGERRPAGPVLEAAGRQPLKLEAREGLALINGTQLMNSLGLLAAARLDRLVRWGVLACALTVEALEGSAHPYSAAFQKLRPHPGGVDVAAALTAILSGSPILAAHAHCPRVQDPYSVRCAPQIIGASLDLLRTASGVLLREAGSVTDNPLLFPATGEVISGGHFHGQPIAVHLDGMILAASELASVSERRIYLMLGGNDGRLPRFLAAEPGLESGMMIAQYLAAGLVSENKNATAPASADSIPTSMGQEDHVSMGSVGAVKLAPFLDRVETVIALELLTAGRALQFITEQRWAALVPRDQVLLPGRWTAMVLDRLGAVADLSPADRSLTADIESVLDLIDDQDVLAEFDEPLASIRAKLPEE